MSPVIMDSVAIHSIEKKYNFKLSWEDYFNVLDNIKNNHKQQKYINYYFWYHYSDMNEDYYKQLMNKPYFKFLKSDSKSLFLMHYLKFDSDNNWIDKYFTEDEMKNGLKKYSFKLYKTKDDKVKEFFNKYEKIMKNDVKQSLFCGAVESGRMELIQFLYEEKGIKKLNKLRLLWSICSDLAIHDTLDMLNYLKKLGIKFTSKDLGKAQNHNQWGYMENTDKLLYFFKQLDSEKNYKELNKTLEKKGKKKNFHKL
jgi:hypothetical protein